MGVACCHGVHVWGVGVEEVWGESGGEVGVSCGVNSGVSGVAGIL